jgi:hypothetical protein
MRNKEGAYFQNVHLVSLGSCKDEDIGFSEQFGRLPMEFQFGKIIPYEKCAYQMWMLSKKDHLQFMIMHV